jgi:hypothetical protein
MNRRELFPILDRAVSALEAAEYKPRLSSEREYAMVTSLANLTLSCWMIDQQTDRLKRGERNRI